MTSLLSDIETFMAAHHVKPTTLGDKALGDKHFVKQLRAGRRVWPETEARVREFMLTYGTPSAEAA